MKYMYRNVVLILVSSFFIFFSCTELTPPKLEARLKVDPEPIEPINLPIEAYIQLFEAGFQASGCPGAAVVIVKGDSIVYEQGFGVRVEGKLDSVDAETVFRLGSVSKGFAGVLTGMLVQRGVLDWEDPVKTYLPDFMLEDLEQTQRVKIKHLLSHSSGLPRHAFTNLIEDGIDLTTIMKMYPSVNLIGTEGEFYAYQNAAYALIQEVIENKMGAGFDSLLHVELLQKAGMERTTTNYEDLLMTGNIAFPHKKIANTKFKTAPLNKKYYNNAIAAGGINASVHDMGMYLKFLLGKEQKALADSTMDYIFSPQVDMKTGRYYRKWEGAAKKAHYGMGWRLVEVHDRQIAFHGGSVNNYQARIAIDRSNGVGVCVLFNGMSNYAGKALPDFFSLYDAYKKENTLPTLKSSTPN